MQYFDIDTNSNAFKQFAKEMEGQNIEANQFARITDTDVSWQGCKNKHLSRSVCPTIIISLKIENGIEPYFILKVRFSQELYCLQAFDTPIAAIDYINNAMNQSRTHQLIISNIWEKYGF